MITKWLIVIAAQVFFIGIFFIGIPVGFSLNEISRIGPRYQLVTPHNTLARIIGLSTKANVSCDDQDKRCVTPTDRHHFNAHVPIIFEDCYLISEEISCEKPQITFTTNTKVLIFGGFSK